MMTSPTSSLPKDMRAIAIAETGAGAADSLQIATRPIPTLREGEVLIQVTAAGVNRPDILQRKGLYPPPAGASDILGLEVAGHVVATASDVDKTMQGAAVCALVSGGGYAEYCTAAAGACFPIEGALDMVEAAALPETLCTVWHNLFQRAYIKDGEAVLVHGGTSGIGTMAIALCKIFGVRIFTTCGSAAKCARAEALGADAAIDYNSEDFVARVLELTDGRGVDVVLDMVGGDYLPRNLACLADDGRHVSIAFQRGAKAEIAIPDLMRRRLSLSGSTLRARSTIFKSLLADEIKREIWQLTEQGHLRPVIDRTFPLHQAAAAHRHMESGAHVGKIVLTIES